VDTLIERNRKMAVVRSNILDDATARQKYIQGVKLLKQEFLGPTTSDLGLDGPASPVSTYDLFVVWHHVAMNTLTPRHSRIGTLPMVVPCFSRGIGSCSSFSSYIFSAC
jgi:hypothetical protein